MSENFLATIRNELLMRTSNSDVCAREDQDVSQRYGLSSPSRYVFFALFYFWFSFVVFFFFS